MVIQQQWQKRLSSQVYSAHLALPGSGGRATGGVAEGSLAFFPPLLLFSPAFPHVVLFAFLRGPAKKGERGKEGRKRKGKRRRGEKVRRKGE